MPIYPYNNYEVGTKPIRICATLPMTKRFWRILTRAGITIFWITATTA